MCDALIPLSLAIHIPLPVFAARGSSRKPLTNSNFRRVSWFTMAWGRSSVPKPPPPPKSALRYCIPTPKHFYCTQADQMLSKLLPLIILLVVLGGFAFVGYHVYLTVCGISTATSEKMEKRNVVFTKDGLKVGVKEMRNENYVDHTQSALVKIWNAASFPAYKSRFWNQDAEINKPASRKPYVLYCL